MGTFKDSLDNILTIDLIDFAYKNGYTELINGKRTATWISIKNPSTGDSIRIRTKPLPMLYNNNDANLSQDRGNIVNFVINRQAGMIYPNPKPDKAQFSKAFTSLKRELGEVFMDKDKNYEIQKSENTKMVEFHKNKISAIVTCTEHSFNYLKKTRNIDPLLIQHPIFKNKIKESPILMPDGKTIGNICFVKTNIDGSITGIVTHYHSAKSNENIKRVYEIKDNIWISNSDNKTDKLIYGESAVDCLSHSTINQSENCAYASLEGEYTETKFEKLLEFYNHIQSPQLISITDNDYNGNNYDLKIAIALYNKKNYGKPIEVVPQHNLNKLIFHNKMEHTNIEALKEKMQRIILLEAPNKHQFFTNNLDLVMTDDHIVINLPYKDGDTKISHYLKPLVEAIHKENNVKFSFEKSKSKDWNQDLLERKKQVEDYGLRIN